MGATIAVIIVATPPLLSAAANNLIRSFRTTLMFAPSLSPLRGAGEAARLFGGAEQRLRLIDALLLFGIGI
ncbi:MAG: hypothetical protein QOF14_635 [Hyphomicrobiales bacterium]|nr:hypothetical protein [Hyphomicrobiales bacterium]